MAEGLFRHLLGGRFKVHSAGTRPSHVRPEAIAVMAELGIDISGHWSKSVDDFLGREFAYIFTVCDNAKESCPVFHCKAERIHWSFGDPAAVEGDQETRLGSFRQIRDQIKARVIQFASEI
jgi:arsenate reductase